jgi:hypothetical protein
MAPPHCLDPALGDFAGIARRHTGSATKQMSVARIAPPINHGKVEISGIWIGGRKATRKQVRQTPIENRRAICRGVAPRFLAGRRVVRL